MHTNAPSFRAAQMGCRRTGVIGRRRSAPPPVAIPVFIAYADITAARHAMNRINANLRIEQSNRKLQPLLWRFDQLDQPRWREMALVDATQASAIVIALSDEMPLNASADAWLANLANRQKGAGIHVTALLNEEFWSISLAPSAAARRTNRQPAEVEKKNPATLVTLPDKKIAARAA